VVAVVLTGSVLAVGLFWLASRGGGGLDISVESGPVLFTVTLVLVLALLTSLAAVRRVLRIDPIAATTGAGVQVG
jgi:ABC-type antimicrobial peptide transport system permease subunit